MSDLSKAQHDVRRASNEYEAGIRAYQCAASDEKARFYRSMTEDQARLQAAQARLQAIESYHRERMGAGTGFLLGGAAVAAAHSLANNDGHGGETRNSSGFPMKTLVFLGLVLIFAPSDVKIVIMTIVGIVVAFKLFMKFGIHGITVPLVLAILGAHYAGFGG